MSDNAFRLDVVAVAGVDTHCVDAVPREGKLS